MVEGTARFWFSLLGTAWLGVTATRGLALFQRILLVVTFQSAWVTVQQHLVPKGKCNGTIIVCFVGGGWHLDDFLGFCLRWNVTFYHGQSPSNHHWGVYVLLVPSILTKYKFLPCKCFFLCYATPGAFVFLKKTFQTLVFYHTQPLDVSHISLHLA